jgi:diaminopimelate decarboxylase
MHPIDDAIREAETPESSIKRLGDCGIHRAQEAVMSVIHALPPQRASLPPRLAPELWPHTATQVGSDLLVGGVSLAALADQFGTPCYVIDEVDVRRRCRDYLDAFGDGAVNYTARAFGCRQVLQWIADEGLGLSVCSAGELAVAAAAGFPAERLILHGEAKTPADLRTALDYCVGRIIIESNAEIPRLAADVTGAQRVLLRVLLDNPRDHTPGIPLGPSTERFGLSLGNRELDKAITRLIGQPHLVLIGLDYALGSQVAHFGGYEGALRQLVDLLAHLNRWYGLSLEEINLGGGFAVAYRAGDPTFAVDAFATRWPELLRAECDRHDISMPRITVTPGRAIIARAAAALYRILAVKRDSEGHQLIAIDGGLADNPRPALYDARYTPMLIGRYPNALSQPTTVIGRYSEAGDVIARDVSLPGDLRPGDVIAVADCGAYQYAMASNYGHVPRPPVVGVRDGTAQVLVRGETIDDLLARDA